MLARQHNLSVEVVKHLQEMAVLQCLVDFNSREGLLKLGTEFKLSQSERIRLIKLISNESSYPCFSFSKHTEMAVNENWASDWKTLYLPTAEEFTRKKKGLLSRLIAYLKK